MDNPSLLLNALHFAADKHRDHRRKDAQASPYINHPIHVAQILADSGGITDPEVLAAAVLHDTVEDTETTIEELEKAFGQNVASIVGEVTDDKTLRKSERKRLQIDHARQLSPNATLVKLADKISNVTDMVQKPPAGWDLARRQEYLDWASDVVNNCPKVNEQLEDQFRDVVSKAQTALGNSKYNLSR